MEKFTTEWVEDRTRCEDCRHQTSKLQTWRFSGVRWQHMVEENLPQHRWMFKVAQPKRDPKRGIDLVFVQFQQRWCSWHGHEAMQAGVLWRCEHFKRIIDDSDNEQEGEQWWSESSDDGSSTQSSQNWWE